MRKQRICGRRDRLLYGALMGLLAVFAFLCSILSECIPPYREVGDGCVRLEKEDTEKKVDSVQVLEYLQDRHLIVTTDEADDWLEFVEYCDTQTEGVWVEPAIVQIVCSLQSGSGFLIEMTPQYLYFATCAHVIGTEESIQIVLWNKESVQGQVFAHSEGFDLAVVAVDASRVSFETKRQLRKVRMEESAWQRLSENDSVFIQASSQSAAGDFYNGEVLYKEVYVPEFDCYMICCRTVALQGMSGGGIFDSSGCLIGMINGGTGNREIVGLSLPVILGQWEQWH